MQRTFDTYEARDHGHLPVGALMNRFCAVILALGIVVPCIVEAQDFRWATNIGTDYSGIQGIEVLSMAVSTNGNSVMVGDFRGAVDFDPSASVAQLTSIGPSDLFIAKYDADGKYVWAKNIGSAEDLTVAFSVVLGSEDNVYVAGHFGASVDFDPGEGVHMLTCAASVFSNQDAFIAKFTSNGDLVWAKSIGGQDLDRINNIALDNDGNIYAAGYFHYTADFDPDAGVAELTTVAIAPSQSNLFIAKYDNNGKYLWAKSIASTTEYIDLAVGGNDNVYITGNFTDTIDADPGAGTAKLVGNSSQNMLYAKYDANGTYQFAHAVSYASSLAHYAHPGRGIGVDNDGNVFLTGVVSSFSGTDFDPSAAVANVTTMGSSNCYIAKYDANGNFVWANALNGDSEAHGLLVERGGTLIVTGIYHSEIDFDFGNGTKKLTPVPNQTFIARYRSNGSFLSARGFGGGPYDFVSGMGVDGVGDLYCSGVFLNDNTDFDPGPNVYVLSKNLSAWQDVFIAKYSMDDVSPVDEMQNDIDQPWVYPNPTAGAFRIKSAHPLEVKRLEVYNVMGERVVALSNTEIFDLATESSGTYYLRIFEGENCSTQIIVLE